MKPYFAALMLSVSVLLLMLVRSVLLIKPTYRKAMLQPNDGPVAQATRPATDIDGRKTECFRLYTPDRKPGVNCVLMARQAIKNEGASECENWHFPMT